MLLYLSLAAAVLALGLAAPAAYAAGTITGGVGDGAGGVGGVKVSIYENEGPGSYSLVRAAYTASDGTYSAQVPDVANYRVLFFDPSFDNALQWYSYQPNLGSATDVYVNNNTVSNISTTLGMPGSIIGTVSDGSDVGIANIRVTVYQADGLGGWTNLWQVTTASNGGYTMGGLAAGNYRLRFVDPSGTYLGHYYDDQSSITAANDIAVTFGEPTPNVNATLALAGHITGTVTDASHTALSGITVAAFQPDGSGGWMMVRSGTTDSGGHYDIPGLSTGNYRVEFVDGGDYLTQCYKNKPDLPSATDVAVTAGHTTANINATLASAGHISGMVTGVSAVGLMSVEVTANQPDGSGGWKMMGYGYSAADGTYIIDGLAPGVYRLEFDDHSGLGYGSQYYDNEPSLAAADAVTVSGGQTTANIDATLALPGSDTTPPTTQVTGVDPVWHKSAVTATLTAIDDAGGSGVWRTEYRLHGSSTWLTCGALLQVSAQGDWLYDYRSIDLAQNAEAGKTFEVKIDWTGPTTSTKAASGRKGRAVALKYLVRDNVSSQATHVTLVVRNSHKKTVKTFSLGSRKIGTWYTLKWTPKATGTYTYKVTARDLAGNVQSKTASARITVK